MSDLLPHQATNQLEHIHQLSHDADAASLKRLAAKAANERDAGGLYTLLAVYLRRTRAARVSPLTLKAYKQAIALLLECWYDVNLLRADRHDGERFRYWLLSDTETPTPTQIPRKPATINKILAGVKSLYKAFDWADVSQATPFKHVGQVPDPVPAAEKVNPYDSAELSVLLEHADTIEETALLLMAHAGLRIHEVAKLAWSDINFPKKTLLIKGKGGYVSSVALSQRLVQSLKRLLHSEDERKRREARVGKVLPYGADRIRQRIRSLCEHYGVDYKGIHALRHTAGTRMYADTLDLRKTQRHLRHRTPATSAIYAAINDNDIAEVLEEWDI